MRPQTSHCKTFGMLADASNRKKSRLYPRFAAINRSFKIDHLYQVLRSGGRGGIRTLDTLSRIHAFQACALNHSATLPYITPPPDLSIPVRKRDRLHERKRPLPNASPFPGEAPPDFARRTIARASRGSSLSYRGMSRTVFRPVEEDDPMASLPAECRISSDIHWRAGSNAVFMK